MSEKETSAYNQDNGHIKCDQNVKVKVYKNKMVEKERDTMDQEEVVQDRIYVSGLGTRIYEGDLFHFFSSFGDVRHVVIITENGTSKGYGFVTFSSKETAKRLLEEQSEEGLFLMGKRLIIRAARKKYGSSQYQDNFKSGQVQRSFENVRPTDSNGVTDNITTDGVIETCNPVEVPKNTVEPSFQVITLQVDPGTQFYNPAQFSPTFTPHNYQHYPVYYPQYVPHELPTYYPIHYQDASQYYPNYQDTHGSGIFPFPTLDHTYQVSYPMSPSYPPLIPDYSMQLPTPGYFWSQSPMYPMYYDTNQSDMTMAHNQSVTTGEFQPDQSVVIVPDQSVFGAECSNGVTVETSEALVDSGFQEKNSSGHLESYSSYYNYDSKYKNAGKYQSQEGRCQGRKKQANDASGKNKSNESLSDKVITNTKNDETKDPNLSQDPKYTKLRSADNAKYPARDMPAINKFGKESRYYPSPYKSFVPFTGNPVPRQFPHPPGHRPYYQGQARGRGKLWGVGQTCGRGQVTARNSTFQKKENIKRKDASNNDIEDKNKNVDKTRASENQPDILQGPLEKLKVK